MAESSSPTPEEGPFVQIKRRVLTQTQFDGLYSKNDADKDDEKQPPQSCCQKFAAKFKATAKEWLPESFQIFLVGLFPLFSVLKNEYNWRYDFIRDLIAGATVTCLHVPQAMAYGQLATLRPIHGLYVAFFPAMIYIFLGTSRQLSVGVFAVSSLMVAKLLDAEIASGTYGLSAMAPGDDLAVRNSSSSLENSTAENSSLLYYDYEAEELRVRVEIATSYNLVIGAIQLLLGVIGAGFITDYLNEPFTSGFTTACAFHVLTAQTWVATGIKGPRHTGAFKIILTYSDLIRLLPKTHWITLAIFLSALSVLVLWKELVDPRIKKKCPIPVPIDLIVVIVVDLVSYFVGLNPAYKVPIVGPIPRDFPLPTVPKHFRLNYLIDSIPLVLVSFSICFSMSKMMAKRNHYEIRAKQEFIALGSANLFSSFFNCYTASTAMSRCLILANLGGKSQLGSLVSCSFILVVILILGRFLQPLPTAILGAVVIANLRTMFLQFRDFGRYWRLCKLDAATWLVAFLVTFLIDVDIGLFAGVGFVFLTIIIQSSKTSYSIQKQVESAELFSPTKENSNLIPTHPAVVVKWSASVYFANVDKLSDAIKSGLGKNDDDNKTVTAIVLDLTAVSFIDSTGVDFFKRTVDELADLNISLLLAGCPSGILLALMKEDFLRQFLPTNAFVSTIDAVTAIQSKRCKLWQKPVPPKPEKEAEALLAEESKV